MRLAAPASGGAVDRFGWLDFAKGLCIVSVVWMWVDKYMELDSGWFHQYARFSLPFRMPDFFLISGLLLGRVIHRPWRNYIDTRVVHYAYFLLLWTMVYVPLSWLATPPASIGAGLQELATSMLAEPKGNLWFLQMLAVYFLFTRITVRVPSGIMLALAIWVYLYPLPTRIFAIELFGDHFVFFYVGYLAAPLILQATNWIQEHRMTAVIALAAWAIGNYIIMVPLDFKLGDNRAIALILRFVGIAGVVAFSSLAWDLRGARWLTYIGRNSIVVYLGFFIPLSFLIMLATRYGVNLQNSWLAFTIWSSCVGLSLLAHAFAMRAGALRYFYERPRWARLAPIRPMTRDATAATTT
jgi:uncharacterized membrane protein YcfT